MRDGDDQEPARTGERRLASKNINICLVTHTLMMLLVMYAVCKVWRKRVWQKDGGKGFRVSWWSFSGDFMICLTAFSRSVNLIISWRQSLEITITPWFSLCCHAKECMRNIFALNEMSFLENIWTRFWRRTCATRFWFSFTSAHSVCMNTIWRKGNSK